MYFQQHKNKMCHKIHYHDTALSSPAPMDEKLIGLLNYFFFPSAYKWIFEDFSDIQNSDCEWKSPFLFSLHVCFPLFIDFVSIYFLVFSHSKSMQGCFFCTNLIILCGWIWMMMQKRKNWSLFILWVILLLDSQSDSLVFQFIVG